MTTPTDPDLRHLADLVSFLPDPNDREFWDQVASKDRPPSDPSYSDYVIKNLIVLMPVLRKTDPRPNEIKKLLQYLMMFFGGDSGRLHEPIGRRFPFVAGRWETIGQLWLEDLVATCWRLYVRYAADGAWAEKWPEDIHAWLETSGRS